MRSEPVRGYSSLSATMAKLVTQDPADTSGRWRSAALATDRLQAGATLVHCRPQRVLDVLAGTHLALPRVADPLNKLQVKHQLVAVGVQAPSVSDPGRRLFRVDRQAGQEATLALSPSRRKAVRIRGSVGV